MYAITPFNTGDLLRRMIVVLASAVLKRCKTLCVIIKRIPPKMDVL